MVLGVEPSQRKGKTYPQWITAIIVNTTLLTYGFQAGWMSPVMKLLQSPDSPVTSPVTTGEMALIASMLCFCAALATPVYSYIADTYGRRVAIFIMAACQAITWIIKLTATTAMQLIIARVVSGIACGGCFNVIPSYTKDISQDSIRGLLGSLVMLFQNIGILVMYALGASLSYNAMIWAVMWVPWVTLALIWCVPESPEFLIKKGRIEEATKAIAFLRGLKEDDKLVESEVDRLKNMESYYVSLPTITYAGILRDRSYRKSFFIIMIMITFQALNGNYAILTYANDILASSGATFSPELQTLSFPAIMIIGSLVSMSCVEKIGRKPLFVINLIVAGIALATLAATILHQWLGGHPPGWLPASTIVAALFTYAAGILPMPYIIMTEMLNFQIRCKILGVVVSYAWFASFLQLLTFVPLSATVGMHSTFFFFAGNNLLGSLVVLVLVPETKGKSTEQIEAILRKKNGNGKKEVVEDGER